MLGSSNLFANGIGIGDMATLFTLGRRIGDWLTAALGDTEMLALLAEDEFDILQRRVNNRHRPILVTMELVLKAPRERQSQIL